MDAGVAGREEEDLTKLERKRKRKSGRAGAEAGERERKRRRTDTQPQPSRWKSPGEQQNYSSKLLEALRHVRRASAEAAAPPRSRAVREAADRALAVAARGRTLWSRAILSNCRALRLRKRRRAVAPRQRKKPPGGTSAQAPSQSCRRKTPALERKVKVLGRLVPGCRTLSFPSLLDEASDYIAALEMQVRTMSALSEILSSLGGGGGAPSDRLASDTPAASSSEPRHT